MEERIFTLSLMCLVFSKAMALDVNIEKDVYEVARGNNITLPCTFKPKDEKPGLVIVTWTAEGAKPGTPESLVLTHYSTKRTTDIAPKYEGRASLDQDIAKGKANLILYSITLEDNKVFECRVQIPGDDTGKLVDTTRLVVMVAPSSPICMIQGDEEYGQNINLTCVSEEGSPPPTYKWESRDVRNMPRVAFADPRTTDKDGILSLYNISRETSGYYTCTSRNKIRSVTCSITLKVMPPSMNIGFTAGIIGGAVAALVILVIIIYCCCCRKKNDNKEEYTMGVREPGAFPDKEPVEKGERQDNDRQEDVRHDYDNEKDPADRRYHHEERSERDVDRRTDYDDRRSDYDDHRSDYDDRRSDYDDRRSNHSDRRDRYTDHRERYDDDHNYDNDRRYDDRRDRRHDDRYDEPYDDRDSGRAPSVPSNKPSRMDYDD
ncbi:cell surface A33 antigen-like [Lampris incognitus]|uniref:cell surface A33 antigen-like n=1 Tax=Lampris incognitus TaxID=2546036 RepID=UPI0024B5102E|nr:cell surface A33 antigen-like [Lampris incognitus]